jgi:hypothetical protein
MAVLILDTFEGTTGAWQAEPYSDNGSVQLSFSSGAAHSGSNALRVDCLSVGEIGKYRSVWQPVTVNDDNMKFEAWIYLGDSTNIDSTAQHIQLSILDTDGWGLSAGWIIGYYFTNYLGTVGALRISDPVNGWQTLAVGKNWFKYVIETNKRSKTFTASIYNYQGALLHSYTTVTPDDINPDKTTWYPTLWFKTAAEPYHVYVDDLVFSTGGVAPPPLVASFTYDKNSGMAPLTVSFADTSIGNPTSWFWNFGDGSTSNLQYPEHVYTMADSFTVTLDVYRESDGMSDGTSYCCILVEQPQILPIQVISVVEYNPPHLSRYPVGMYATFLVTVNNPNSIPVEGTIHSCVPENFVDSITFYFNPGPSQLLYTTSAFINPGTFDVCFDVEPIMCNIYSPAG